MTIAISPTTVSAAIAALSISGVTLKDIDEIPESAQMLTPLIVPRPNDFITNIKPEAKSFGSNGSELMDVSYSLNYVFCYTEIGSGINAFAPYSGLLSMLILIINTILNNDKVNGLVDIQLESIGDIGSVEDFAGNKFWGCNFSLRCLEFAQ